MKIASTNIDKDIAGKYYRNLKKKKQIAIERSKWIDNFRMKK